MTQDGLFGSVMRNKRNYLHIFLTCWMDDDEMIFFLFIVITGSAGFFLLARQHAQVSFFWDWFFTKLFILFWPGGIWV